MRRCVTTLSLPTIFTERQNKPGFDVVFAELGEGAVGLGDCQLAKWAEVFLLVTEADHAAESWELVRDIMSEANWQDEVSIGVVFNKTDSAEHGEAGFAALEVAARSAKRRDAFKLWYAGAIPFEPGTIGMSEHDGRVVVDAFPRGRISREIRVISKRLSRELINRGTTL
jgi:hypothetical protein